MANGLPSFTELFEAFRQGGDTGQTLRAGAKGLTEGLDLASTLEQRRQQIAQGQQDIELRRASFAQRVKEAMAGQIQPGEKPGVELKRPVTPAVAKALTKPEKKARELKFTKTADEIISQDPTTGEVINRVAITDTKGKKVDVKTQEQLLSLTRSIANVDKITDRLFETDEQGNLIRTRRELLLPGASRGIFPKVDAEDARAVTRDINFLVFELLKSYQGARPSDKDLEIFQKTIRPLALSFAKGQADREFFDDMKSFARFTIKIKQKQPISTADPDFEAFQRFGSIMGGIAFERPGDAEILEAVNLQPGATSGEPQAGIDLQKSVRAEIEKRRKAKKGK